MYSIRRLFGVPQQWRALVPLCAMAAAVAVVVAGAPSAAADDPPRPVPSIGEPPAARDAGAAPLEAADGPTARTIARVRGVPVEILSERTEHGSVFVLPDGTMLAGQASGPVWVRRGGDGSASADWAPVDLALGKSADGMIRPKAHPGDLAFAGGPSSEAAGVDVAVVTDSTSGIATRVRWDGELPEPQLQGRRAIYEDVEPGIDLVLEATSTGFEQFFVLEERPAPGTLPDLTLTVEADGAELEHAPDGGLSVVDGDAAVATLPVAHMWDAEADRGRAFPITEDRPAEVPGASILAPMPAWAVEDDHARERGDVERARPGDAVASAEVVGDPSLPEAVETVEVEREVDLLAPDTAVVNLVPQEDFLQDPSTTYPVVVDPDLSMLSGFDTHVLTGYSDNRSGRTDLQVGSFNGGATIGRAFIHFPTSSLAGKDVISAELGLYNFYSYSCSAREWRVWSSDPAGTGTTWGNQPSLRTHYSTSGETFGYSGNCPGDWAFADVTRLASDIATSRASTAHIAITAANESDSYGWKKFLAADNGSGIPTLWVTYNQDPTKPTGLRVSHSPNGSTSGTWTSSTEPTVSFQVGDPDGNPVSYRIDLKDPAGAITEVHGSGTVANGAVASVKIPAGRLQEGAVYQVRAVTGDGRRLSPATDWFHFGVDTKSPAAPTLSSAAFPNSSTWSGTPGQEAAFTVVLPSDSSVSAYRWALDKAPDAAQQVGATSGQSATLKITPAEAGRHVLQVQAVDRAGNTSGVAKFVFRVGQAGIVAPDEGARVVRQVRLSVEAKPELKYVSFEWRRGPDAEVEKQVPPANLRSSTGKVWSSTWQALPTGSSYTTWDVGTELGDAGGPAQVRARLSASPDGATWTPSQWVTVVVDPDADGASTKSIAGPGSVNLLTGDHLQSATDVDEFGLQLVRTASSRDPDDGYELQPNGLTPAQQEGTSLAGLAGNALVAVDSVRRHSGATSYRLTSPGGAPGDFYTGIGGDTGGMRLSMRAGRSYRISGWIFVPTATGLTPDHARGLSLALFTRSGSGPYSDPVQTGQRTPLPTIRDAWQQVSVDVTVPTGATEAFVRMYNGFTTAGKTVYFDDIKVQELWSPFGPEWALGAIDGASGSAYTRITKPHDDVASVEVTGGGQVWFTEGSNGTWSPEPGAESLQLTPTSASSWRLTDLDGTVSEFARDGSTGDFLIRSSAPPSAAGAVRPVYDTSLAGVSRLRRLIAPIEPGVDDWPRNSLACTTATPAPGCRVIELDYATTTTAAGNAVGAYAGRVSVASVWTWDGAAMVKRAVASYAYDAGGRLRQVHDPRIVAAGDLAQVTVYEYDSAGRVTSVRVPGELPYRFTFGAGGRTKTGSGDWIDPAPGRLLSVTQASLVTGTVDELGPDNTTTVVYDVPLSRSAGGPYDLDPDSIARWWQQDAPTDATAVFGPLDPPGRSSATSTEPGRDGYKFATVSYLNSSGLEVNSASPPTWFTPVHGTVDTTEYDARGNVVRTLSSANRLLALDGRGPDLGLEDLSSVEVAQLFDTRHTFSEDGLDLLTTLGPARELAVGNDPDDLRLMRSRTTNVYDEGKPDGVSYHLVTTRTTDAVDLDGSAHDPVVIRSGYTPIDGTSALGPTSGWLHKKTTWVTVDADRPGALPSTIVFDDRGRPVRSSLPGSTGSDAGTTMSVYYTAGPNSADATCGDKPAWAGLPCVTRAAGAVTGHDPARMPGELPTKRVDRYSPFDSPSVVIDIAGSGAQRVVRTSTTTHDAADRVVSVSSSGTGNGAGEAVATRRTSYDRATGAVVRQSSLDAGGQETTALVTKYDALGRTVRYTDSTGAWTTNEYDRLGRPVKMTDSLATTREFEYDRSEEPRGFLTKIVDSVAGEIVPYWGDDGELIMQDLPGNLRLWLDYDTSGEMVGRAYTEHIGSSDSLIYSDGVVENHRGQWVQHSVWDGYSGHRNYTYDRMGRLTGVDELSTWTFTCASRRYTYDSHSNRTAFSSANSATEDCPGSDGATVTTSTYDSADRLVSTSGPNGAAWRYDQFGRVTAMPTDDGSEVASLSYFLNDLAAGQVVPGGERSTWTLDPAQRFLAQSSSTWDGAGWGASRTSVSHFSDDSDKPAWIVPDATQPDVVTRFVEGADGALAVQTGADGDRVVQMIDMHGDVIATVPVLDGEDGSDWENMRYAAYDEFGAPQAHGDWDIYDVPDTYGWLGAQQRSADTPTGAVLMGSRLYSPAHGRFLQVDPVPGGSANAYDYCGADPVNCSDLDGRTAIPIVPIVILAAALAAVVWVAFQRACKYANNCMVSMPALPVARPASPVIPFPRKASTGGRPPSTPYIVYHIYAPKVGGGGKVQTWKYGISSNTYGTRPQSQLGQCNKWAGRGPGVCTYSIVSRQKGFYNARFVEASLILKYRMRYGKCPDGNPVCR